MQLPVGKTDPGRVREMNQDEFGIRELPGGAVLMVVCDGMGGASGGQIASAKGVELILASITGRYTSACDNDELRSLLCRSITEANEQIHAMAMEDTALRGMGTTVVAALVRDRVAHLASAGDSRAYRITAGRGIEQLTRDHSMVQYLVDSGQLSQSEARNHPRKNLITRALGVEAGIEVDYLCVALEAGSRLLLCTDGLTNCVEDEEMEKMVLDREPQAAVEGLIELANARGGPDNITAVLMTL